MRVAMACSISLIAYSSTYRKFLRTFEKNEDRGRGQSAVLQMLIPAFTQTAVSRIVLLLLLLLFRQSIIHMRTWIVENFGELRTLTPLPSCLPAALRERTSR